MRQFATLFALAAFLTFGLGTTLVSANEPAPTEQKEKKDIGGKLNAEDQQKKSEKKDIGGQFNADEQKKTDKNDMGGK